MLKIRLNSPIPIYEQLVNSIQEMLVNKELKPGDELPSIRSLAGQLEVANNTVARAYQELERKGMIVSNGRKGTFIKEFQGQNDVEISRLFKDSILKMLKAGLDEKDIKVLFEKNMNEIFK